MTFPQLLASLKDHRHRQSLSFQMNHQSRNRNVPKEGPANYANHWGKNGDMQLLSILINLRIRSEKVLPREPGSSHLSSRLILSPGSSWNTFWKTCVTLLYHGRAQLFGTSPRSDLYVRMVHFSAWSILQHLVWNISCRPSVSSLISPGYLPLQPAASQSVSRDSGHHGSILSWIGDHTRWRILRMLTFEAMFDRPWRGARAASNESLDLAANAGIQV